MIKELTRKDIKTIANLSLLLWPHHFFEYYEESFKEVLKSNKDTAFIYFLDSIPIGFAHVSLRYDYVEGTKTSPVGYLEGIFIKHKYRNNGFAKELLSSCEAWAKTKNCLKFASDCELTNETSFNFHLNLGFSEANRIICFKKSIK